MDMVVKNLAEIHVASLLTWKNTPMWVLLRTSCLTYLSFHPYHTGSMNIPNLALSQKWAMHYPLEELLQFRSCM
jgi:hypothetical protein